MRKLSLEQAKCLCYILSLAGKLFTLPAAHRKEASECDLQGKLWGVDDESVNVEAHRQVKKLLVWVEQLQESEKHSNHMHRTHKLKLEDEKIKSARLGQESQCMI